MGVDSDDLVAAQQAYQDAVERRRRMDEIRPPDLPGAEGAENSTVEAWRARKAAADADVAETRRRLDEISGTAPD
ncbi:hypothetical protein WDZ92_43035 [Nostoc sp. NIES-2111]